MDIKQTSCPRFHSNATVMQCNCRHIKGMALVFDSIDHLELVQPELFQFSKSWEALFLIALLRAGKFISWLPEHCSLWQKGPLACSSSSPNPHEKHFLQQRMCQRLIQIQSKREQLQSLAYLRLIRVLHSYYSKPTRKSCLKNPIFLVLAIIQCFKSRSLSLSTFRF